MWSYYKFKRSFSLSIIFKYKHSSHDITVPFCDMNQVYLIQCIKTIHELRLIFSDSRSKWNNLPWVEKNWVQLMKIKSSFTTLLYQKTGSQKFIWSHWRTFIKRPHTLKVPSARFQIFFGGGGARGFLLCGKVMFLQVSVCPQGGVSLHAIGQVDPESIRFRFR